MRLLFAGTPAIAVPSLRALAGEGWVGAVLTNADSPSGRGGALVPSPVKCAALELGLPVLEPSRLADAEAAIRAVGADTLVAVAYGRVFRPAFLAMFPRGGVNVHPSLLPRHRGPSPIPATILAGDTSGGVTVQRLAAEVDSGAILAQRTVPLDGTETTRTLTELLATMGADLLVGALRGIENGTVTERDQDPRLATWCRKLEKSHGLIDWSEDAVSLGRKVRAYDPYPGTHTTWGGRTLRILEAGPLDAGQAGGRIPESAVPGIVLGSDKRYGILVLAGSGVVGVRRLQLEARKALDWRAFLNGVPGFEGSHLGRSPNATTVDGQPAHE